MNQGSCFNLLQGDFGDSFLREVLMRLDQRDLFGSVASVNRDWKMAYATVCTYLRAQIKDIESGEQLAVWMDKHKDDLQGVLEVLSASFSELDAHDDDDIAERTACRIFKSITAAGPQLRSLEVDVNRWHYMLGEEVPLSSMTGLTSVVIKNCYVDGLFMKSLLPLKELQVLALIDVQCLAEDAEESDYDPGIMMDFLVALPESLPQLSKSNLSGCMQEMHSSGGVGSLLPVFEKLPLIELKLGAFEGFDEEELAMAKALPLVDVVIQAPTVREQYVSWAAHPSRSKLRELQVFCVIDYDHDTENVDAILRPLHTSAPHLTKLTLTACNPSISPITGFSQLRALVIRAEDDSFDVFVADDDLSMLSSLTNLGSLTLHQVIEVTGKGGWGRALAAGLVQLTELRFWGEGSAEAYGAALEAFQNAPVDARNRVNIHGPECSRNCEKVHSPHIS